MAAGPSARHGEEFSSSVSEGLEPYRESPDTLATHAYKLLGRWGMADHLLFGASKRKQKGK